MLGPRSIVERLDCDNDALQREVDDAREALDVAVSDLRDAKDEITRMLGMNDLASIKTSLRELRDEMEGNLTRGTYRV